MNKFIPKQYNYFKVRKRLKFRTKIELKHTNLKMGTLGIKSLEAGQLSSIILEAVRKSLSKRIKKIGKMFFFIHPNIPLTKKPLGVRMGKGAGSLDKWIFPVKKGKVMIELQNVPQSLGILALKSVAFKIPFKTRIIYN